MIDEKKMLKELEEIKSNFASSSVEEKVLSEFQAYIRKQKCMEVGELLFLNRMKKVAMIVSEAGIFQIEGKANR